jgi:hypothetical protein
MASINEQKNSIDNLQASPTTAELADAVAPYLLRMLKEHPAHGSCMLKLQFRDSRIAFIVVDQSASFLPGCLTECSDSYFKEKKYE